MHKMIEVSLKGKLNLAPIPSDPQRILDLGCGTGLWTIEIGDKYPNAEVVRYLSKQETLAHGWIPRYWATI